MYICACVEEISEIFSFVTVPELFEKIFFMELKYYLGCFIVRIIESMLSFDKGKLK